MRQHETLPGPGPGPGRNATLTGAAGVRPVEQMVDAAIELVAREQKAHDREAHEIELRALDRGEHENGVSRQTEHALAVPGESGERAGKPTRLRWKGLDVSDEFRNYAERVARGEDLPPFEGPVLAQPNPAFPFGPAPVVPEPAQEAAATPPGRASRVALWTSAALVVALIGWSLAHRVDSESSSAALHGTPSVALAPLTATPAAAGPSDVVDTPASTEAQALAGNPDPGVADVASSLSDSHALEAPPPTAAVALPSSAAVAASSSEPVVSVVPTPAPGASAARATVATPLASQQSVTPVPAAAPVAANASTAAAVAPAKAVPEDDFGILPAGDEATATSPANPPLPGAKSVPSVNGNVGDVARSAQAPGAPARKAPGGESSAKGSLLVETPSF